MATGSRRTRDRRRADARTPAVYRGAVAERTERPAVEHGARGGVRFSWRYVSGFIAVLMLGLLGLFFGHSAFYVHTVAVGGVQTLTKEEVFALTDIANLHVFWVDPDAVRERLLESPTIADAQVRLGWPPQMVQILIQEREPALVWEQAGAATWVDIHGQVMQLREDRPGLLRVTYEGLAPDALALNDQIPPDVVNGALQLRELLLTVDVLRYSADYGLGFRDARGWDAWFGVGTDMPDKILIYNALVEDLQARGIQPTIVSVGDPSAVYYATLN